MLAPWVTEGMRDAKFSDSRPNLRRELLLVTTLHADTVEQVRAILQNYTVRFLIEVLLRILKSGCRVEERRFEHIDRRPSSPPARRRPGACRLPTSTARLTAAALPRAAEQGF